MAEKSKGNEYSVYAGIDDSPPVNWGTIAGTISDQLLAVKKDREAQKAAIEQQTVDQMAELNKLPDVNDRSLSKILIEGSDRSKQELQMRMKLVKSGAIKPKDYTLFMNEQKNGYSEFSNVIKNWDKWNEKKMESIKNGTASAFDQANALSIESFGNLQNKTIMTNPANGQLQVVTMLKGKDGKYTKMPNAKTNPENFAAPGTLNSRMAFDEEKKVTSELVNKEVAFIGEEIKARSLGNGVVETVEDFTQSAAYPDWKKASIAKLTSNDYDIVQILAEDSRYSIASSEAEFKEKNPGVDLKFFIEMDQSGNKPVPKLSEGQKKAAKGMVDTLIESQLGRKEDLTREYDQNTPSKTGDKTEKDKGKRIMSTLNSLRGAKTPEQMQLAIQEMQGISGLKFQDIEEIRETVKIDGKEKEITTGINLNLGGTVIPMKFGEIDPDTKEFKPTTGDEFALANYEYLKGDGGVSADIALTAFGGKDKFFSDVSFDLGPGSRNKAYQQKGNVEFNKAYNSGGEETSLKKQINKAYGDADSASVLGNDMEVLVSGTKSAIASAFEGQGKNLPKDFKVVKSGKTLIIKGIDSEGIPIEVRVEDIGNATDEGNQILSSSVQDFLTKMN